MKCIDAVSLVQDIRKDLQRRGVRIGYRILEFGGTAAMKHRIEVTKHTPFELTPHGYVRFAVRDDETDEVIGTLEVR